MKSALGLLISIVLLVPALGLTQEPKTAQRPVGEVHCDHDIQKSCTYTTENLSAPELLNIVSRTMFPDDVLDRSVGFKITRSSNEIEFYFNDIVDENDVKTRSPLLERFISLIMRFDVQDDFNPPAYVEFTTEVYSVSKTAITAIKLALSNANPDNVPDTGTISYGFKLKNLELALALGLQVSRGNAHQVFSASSLVPNKSDIDWRQTTNIYVSPNSTDLKTEKSGLDINGVVSINRNDKTRMLLSNFRFTYGVEIPPANDGDSPRVDELNFPLSRYEMKEGIPTLLMSTKSFNLISAKGLGIGNTGYQKYMKETKLVVVIRAKAFTQEDLIAANKDILHNKTLKKFSEEEVQNFPNDAVSIDEVLDSTRAKIEVIESTGDRVIRFWLDKDLARRDNYKKRYWVKITAQGFQHKRVRSIEHLMLKGINTPPMPYSLLQKNLIKFKIRFRKVREWRFFHHRKRFYYEPEYNDLFEP